MVPVRPNPAPMISGHCLSPSLSPIRRRFVHSLHERCRRVPSPRQEFTSPRAFPEHGGHYSGTAHACLQVKPAGGLQSPESGLWPQAGKGHMPSVAVLTATMVHRSRSDAERPTADLESLRKFEAHQYPNPDQAWNPGSYFQASSARPATIGIHASTRKTQRVRNRNDRCLVNPLRASAKRSAIDLG